MRRPRPLHLSLLLAWMVILGVLWWLGTHPALFMPYFSGLVSRNLLHMSEGGLEVRDARIRIFEGVDLYGVSLTMAGKDGALTLATADTVEADFTLGGILGAVTRLRRVTVANPRIFVRAVAGADSTAGPGPGATALPVVVLDQLVIEGANMTVTGPDGRLLERVSDLDWSGAVDTRDGVSLLIRRAGLSWPTHGSDFADLRGRVRITRLGIQTDRLWGLFNGHPVEVRGLRSWSDSLDLEVRAQGVSVGEIEDLLDQNIGFRATGDVDATLRTSGDTLVYAGVFNGELEGYRMRDLKGRALILPDSVHIRDMSGLVNGASFTGGGDFDVRDSDAVTFTLAGKVEDADLSAGLIPGAEDLPATDGHGDLRIEHSDNPMWTRVTGSMRDGFIDILPFDSCRLDVEATPDSVVFNGVTLVYRNLEIDLSGVTDSLEVFHGSVQAASNDLRTLPESLGWPALRGLGGAEGSLAGPVDALTFRGRIAGSDMGLGNLRADDLRAQVAITHLLDAPGVTGSFTGRGLNVGDVPLGRFRGAGWADSNGNAALESFASALGDTMIRAAVTTTVIDSVRRFTVSRLGIDLEGTTWSLPAPARFMTGSRSFTLEPASLVSEHGSLAAAGRAVGDSLLTGSLRLDRFDLALLNPFVHTGEPLAGDLSAEVMVAGTPSQPAVEVDARLVQAPFALATVDSAHVVGGFRAGVADIEHLDLRSQYGRLLLSGTVGHPGAGVKEFWPGADLDLDLEIPDGDWAFMEQFALPALDRLSGRFRGRMHVGGRTDDPVCSGRLESEPFNIHWLHLDRLTGTVWVDRQTLVLGELEGNQDQLVMTGRIEVPLELDFLSEPVSPPDGPFFMRLNFPQDSDLEPLARATNAFATCSGRGEGEIIVAGPLEHPLYEGTFAIRDAGFVLRDLEEVYHECSCDGHLSGDKLYVRNIDGREGLKGRFRGEGTVTFDGLLLRTFDIRLDLERFLVASIPDLAAVVSGRNGRMVGVKVGPDSLLVPRFEGDLKVDKALYSGDFSEKPGVADPLEATVAPDWMANLRLHAEPRVGHIVNRDMELDLGGDLDLIRDENGLNLRGTLDINKGRLIVFNNSFEVLRGRLDFSRELGFDPRVDIQAQAKYRLRSKYSSNSIIEHIGVQITGSLFKPEITFSSERGYSREAIQRMLLGLQPEATPEGDRGRLANSSIAAGFNLLEREIARELNIFDTFEIDQIQRERETGGTGLDPLIGVGKYIGSDLYLKYAQGVRQNDRDVLVEYQINNHLLLQSEIRRRIDENQGEPTYNLDLKYRFEY